MVKQQNITIPQLKKLHCLLNQLGIIEYKKQLLLQFTSDRTDSANGLTFDEARFLIGHLSKQDPRMRHIKAIWSLAHTAGIIWGDSAEDNKINAAKLNLFLRDKGTVKKDLHKMSLEELKKVHRQFEAITKNIGKSKDNKTAQAATDKLLSELNITVKS